MEEYKQCPEEAKILASFGKKFYRELTNSEWEKIFEHIDKCAICQQNEKAPIAYPISKIIEKAVRNYEWRKRIEVIEMILENPEMELMEILKKL